MLEGFLGDGAACSFRVVDISYAVYRLEALEFASVRRKCISDFYDVLIEGATSDIGMDAPDGMNEAAAGEDCSFVRYQVGENSQLFATDLYGLTVAEGYFQTGGINVGAAKLKDLLIQFGVFGNVEVLSCFGTSKDCVYAGDKLRETERFGNVIIAAHVQPFNFVNFRSAGRKEDHWNLDIFLFKFLQEGETG